MNRFLESVDHAGNSNDGGDLRSYQLSGHEFGTAQSRTDAATGKSWREDCTNFVASIVAMTIIDGV
jgi:hypothetical protein